MASTLPVNRQNYSVQIASPVGSTIAVGTSSVLAAAAESWAQRHHLCQSGLGHDLADAGDVACNRQRITALARR
jgi:hypothetical protein